MNEKYVQVPVSLSTEALRRVARNEGLWEPEAALVEAAADEIDELRALLSQPTPTDRCGEKRPHDAHEGDRGYGDEPDIDWVHWSCPGVTEPPCIDDMAPGTTFTAVSLRGPERWTRQIDGVTDRHGNVWAIDELDPSTIRDVTPPA